MVGFFPNATLAHRQLSVLSENFDSLSEDNQSTPSEVFLFSYSLGFPKDIRDFVSPWCPFFFSGTVSAMPVLAEILKSVKETSGKLDKVKLLKENKDHPLLGKILSYTYNPYQQYHFKKVPSVKEFVAAAPFPFPEANQWAGFFGLLDLCNIGKLSGNAATMEMLKIFSRCTEENEGWMRKVLNRHLNIGITANSINKAFGDLIPTFEVQLAHKFEAKRVEKLDKIGIEPKLDGVRCITVVQDGKVNIYSRKGKTLDAQDAFAKTFMPELASLGDGVFDGELYGKDFKSTIEQVRRKHDADVSGIKLHVWDWMPVDDWVEQNTSLTTQDARETLEDLSIGSKCKFVEVVPRMIVHPREVRKYHDMYVEQGYEGAMVKLLDSTYKFGRGHNVMKYKHFDTADLSVTSFEEGEGKYQGMLGALVVARPHKGSTIRVKVGSGFSDKQREEIWANRSTYRGKTVEVQYFEVTPDGSLRFPTFVGWRMDK
jgi:DNA ligase-1